MKKIFCLVVIVAELILLSVAPALAKFPERPINIVVYLKPGGAGDVFARRFEKIAAKYTDANFVVMNKPGAGGMVALTYIVQGKPDGYNLAYVTKSNIAQFANPKAKIKIDDLDWLAMLVSDPESLIVRKNAPIRTLDQIVADAKAKKGGQIWVGPAAGGNDHIMARRHGRRWGFSASGFPLKAVTRRWSPSWAATGRSMWAILGMSRGNRIWKMPSSRHPNGWKAGPGARSRRSRSSASRGWTKSSCGAALPSRRGSRRRSGNSMSI